MSSLLICTVYGSVFNNLIELHCKYMPLFYNEKSDEIEALDEDEPPPKAHAKSKEIKIQETKAQVIFCFYIL